MKSRDFCFWLQGFFEIAHKEGEAINPEQAKMIQRHLALVFKHDIDPSMPDPTGELQDIHDGAIHSHSHPFSPTDTLIRC